MQHRTCLLPVTVLLLACSPQSDTVDVKNSTPISAPVVTSLADDLIYFSDLFEGEYNNFHQAEDGVPTNHYIYRKVDLPSFGDHVIYVQQYYGVGDDKETVYRQRIYQSYADSERNEIVTKIYSFKDGGEEQVVDAQFYPNLLSALKPADMNTLPDGCEIFWSRKREDIIGYQRPGDCVMKVPNTDMTMILSDNLKLTKTSFTTQTIGNDLEGDRIFGGDEPKKMYRASVYTCDLSGDDDTSAKFRIHDLGGRATLSAYGIDETLRLTRMHSGNENSPRTLDFLDANDSVLASSYPSTGTLSATYGSNTISCSTATNPWATF